jgi:hypothetical protein
MSKLTTNERNALPDSAFAGPHRSYPVEDASHAKNAKARATQMHDRGILSLRAEHLIDAKADQVLENNGKGNRE